MSFHVFFAVTAFQEITKYTEKCEQEQTVRKQNQENILIAEEAVLSKGPYLCIIQFIFQLILCIGYWMAK